MYLFLERVQLGLTGCNLFRQYVNLLLPCLELLQRLWIVGFQGISLGLRAIDLILNFIRRLLQTTVFPPLIADLNTFTSVIPSLNPIKRNTTCTSRNSSLSSGSKFLPARSAPSLKVCSLCRFCWQFEATI